MSNLKFYLLLATGSLIILLFSCKRKNNITDIPNDPGVITSNSFLLQDFLIQDAADARVLDFLDVHRIVQETDTTKVRKGAVDTIYCSVLETIDIKTLKLKPRFYDVGRVVSITPDTIEVRDLTNDGVTYPTMKVQFNTGLVRTFAIVAKTIPKNQDYENLLLNQHNYYLSEYKVYNEANTIIASLIKIKLLNHQPILLQSFTEDTIEFSVVYNDVIGNNIHFTPLKYGDENMDTAVVTLNPTELIFDKTNTTDLANYKMMTITFADGFVRKYAVKATVIDNNENLNKNAYIIGKYDFKNGSTTITGLAEVQPLTQHTPIDRILQKDTIDVTVPSTFAGSSVDFSVTSYGLDPATYTANDSVKTTVQVSALAHNGTTSLVVASQVVTIPLSEFGNYVSITYTFSNGFKRQYAVRVTKLPPPPVTNISFSDFNVSDAGASVQYTKIDTTGLTTDGNTFINGTDTAVMIIRPLAGWTGGRTVTLNFTGLNTNDIRASLSLYDDADGIAPTTTATASGSTISLATDFSNITADSVLLTLKNTNTGGEERHYKIKLLSGIMKRDILGNPSPRCIMDGTATSVNYANTSPNVNTTGSSSVIDKEFKIAVDENYVYVLIINNTGASGSLSYTDLYTNSTYDLYAYPIAGGFAPTGTLPQTATSPIKMNTGSNKFIEVISFSNVLYGISLNALTGIYQIWKWNNPSTPGSITTSSPTPIAISSASTTYASVLALYTANISGTTINFYASITGGATGVNDPSISQLSTDIYGSSSSTISFTTARKNWTITGGSGSIGYATYLDIPNIRRGIVVSSPYGFSFGSDYQTPPATTAHTLGIYTEAAGARNPIGANLEEVRDINYFIQLGLGSTTNSMYVFDFSKNLTKMIDTITNIPAKKIYSDKIESSNNTISGNALKNRGGCRSYKMSNGKVRIAALVNQRGFKVWDME